MAVHVYNTMSRSLEEVIPLEGDHLRLYTCGPTVYDYAHIGNFRAYMFEDLLRRYLEFRGFQVTHVMNLTDVDDKTIRVSQEQGIPLKEYTAKYIAAFYEDLDLLHIKRADAYPAATDHIQEMIELIQTLIEKGHAYPSEDGSVYFKITSIEDYGKLAHVNLEGMQSGVRIDSDEYEKDHVGDFALWKAWDEKDGDVAWDSPFGKGRPGWHIECSAMSMKHLGPSFDMHCGGIDNMFPHHEDEIAQSEAATGKPFVKYWMHCAHLQVEGQKMAKSAGNFYTLRQLMDKGYSGREIRYELISTHYRQSLNFTFDGLTAAKTALSRVDEFSARLKELAGQEAPAEESGWVEKARARFVKAMDQDLNISGGLAAVFDMVTDGNRAMDGQEVCSAEAASALAVLKDLDQVLGCLEAPAEAVPTDVQALADQRQQARVEKDWGEADRLRDEIQALGWTVKDSKDGPKLSRI